MAVAIGADDVPLTDQVVVGMGCPRKLSTEPSNDQALFVKATADCPRPRDKPRRLRHNRCQGFIPTLSWHAMTMTDPDSDDRLRLLALTLPFLVRLFGDGTEVAMQRLLLLALALGITYAWAALFARRTGRPLGSGLPAFAVLFVVMLPGPVGWGGAVLALSFGAVFGREIFGGRAILPPALIGLAFAIFSFPEGGFEAQGILALSPDYVFALSCLPGAVILMLRGSLAWQVAAGAVAGAAAAGLLMGDPVWWQHPGLGAFSAGILFLAAAPEGAIAGSGARWLLGMLVGALIVAIRLANPDQPDGVVFAALLGGLFAPLLDRALAWRPRHG